jgi:archaellin
MKVIKIVVNQAAGLSTCAVVPTNIVTLSDQLAFDYTYTKNTKYYQLEIWSKDVVDRWSDSDILTELLKNEHSTPNDQYITSLKNLYPNTEYVICTVAFDSDGKRGELIKTSLQTKSKVSIDALANINDAGVNGNYLVWTISKEGYCDTYHMICGTDCSIDAVSCYPVVYSWIINYYLKYNKQVLYDNNYSINLDLLNGGSYKLVYKLSTSNVFVATWGKFKDGTMSPTCQCVRGKISPPESAKMYRGNNVLFSSRKNAEPILVRTPKSAFKGIFVR